MQQNVIRGYIIRIWSEDMRDNHDILNIEIMLSLLRGIVLLLRDLTDYMLI